MMRDGNLQTKNIIDQCEEVRGHWCKGLVLMSSPLMIILEVEKNLYRLQLDDVFRDLVMDNDRQRFGLLEIEDRCDSFEGDSRFYIDLRDLNMTKKYATCLFDRFLMTEDRELYPSDVDSVIEDSLNRVYYAPDLHWETDDEEETYKMGGMMFPCSGALLRDDEGNHYGAVYSLDEDIFMGFILLQVNGDFPLYPDEDTKEFLKEKSFPKTGRWIIKDKKFIEDLDDSPYCHLQRRFSSRFDALHWVEDTVKEQLGYRGPNEMKTKMIKMRYELINHGLISA